MHDFKFVSRQLPMFLYLQLLLKEFLRSSRKLTTRRKDFSKYFATELSGCSLSP